MMRYLYLKNLEARALLENQGIGNLCLKKFFFNLF